MDLTGKRALVTGGSSGIGLELAGELLQNGAQVVIVGRRADAIDHAVRQLSTAGKVETIVADITTPGRQQALVDEAVDRLGGLDLLVNNAGGVRAGPLDAIDEADIRQMVEVNLTAPILLARAALPALRASSDALIVSVSSSIAQVAMPYYATYAAVKAGIAHFDEALRRELDGSGVRVLTVYPTATERPMMASSDMGRFNGRERASDVAAAIIAAIANGDRDVIRGDEERLQLIELNRSDPSAVDARMLEMRDTIAEAVRNHRSL